MGLGTSRKCQETRVGFETVRSVERSLITAYVSFGFHGLLSVRESSEYQLLLLLPVYNSSDWETEIHLV